MWHGYLANIPPSEFAERFEHALPETMSGAEFLTRYHGITDTVTRVDRARQYPVRLSTAHPILEQARVQRFADLLGELPANRAAASELGKLDATRRTRATARSDSEASAPIGWLSWSPPPVPSAECSARRSQVAEAAERSPLSVPTTPNRPCARSPLAIRRSPDFRPRCSSNPVRERSRRACCSSVSG